MVRNSNSGHCIPRMLQALHLSEPGRHTRFLGLTLRISEEYAIMISRREIRYQVERASKHANITLFPFPKRGTRHCECTCRNRIKDLNKLSPAPRLKARARTVQLLTSVQLETRFPTPLVSHNFSLRIASSQWLAGNHNPQLLRVIRRTNPKYWRRGGGNGRRLGLQGVAGRGERFIETLWTFPFLMLYLFSCASLGNLEMMAHYECLTRGCCRWLQRRPVRETLQMSKTLHCILAKSEPSCIVS